MTVFSVLGVLAARCVRIRLNKSAKARRDEHHVSGGQKIQAIQADTLVYQDQSVHVTGRVCHEKDLGSTLGFYMSCR